MNIIEINPQFSLSVSSPPSPPKLDVQRRVGEGCLPTNFKTPYCTPLKIFKYTLDLKTFEHFTLKIKCLDVPG